MFFIVSVQIVLDPLLRQEHMDTNTKEFTMASSSI